MRWSEEYDLWCKMKFFGEALQMLIGQEKNEGKRGPQNMLDLLPDTFTKDQAKEMRRSQGLNEETYEMLRNWKRRNFITFDKETGIYKKGESYIRKRRVA